MGEEYTFQELIDITKKVIEEFDKVEQRPWTVEVTMMELSKQVGDLAKHIMVFEKYYLKKREEDPNYKTTKEDIGDELADILYCLIRIAQHYKINLEETHLEARRNELKSLGKNPFF
ncbi:MAG: MazG-like family protein [Candidatus Aenigmarchaeota archaeon]|nr:MazG-like family protein [Candidatus Aenigmarchaeota archaeon]